VLRTRVLEPLGMHDTGFWTKHTDRLATAYRPMPEGLVTWDEPDRTWSRRPVDPARDLCVIVLSQRMFETNDPPQVHRDIQAAAYAALA
jgi:hypothetical protein